MRNRWFSQSLAAILAVSTLVIGTIDQAFAYAVSMSKDTINLNSKTFGSPYGFTNKGTTYMPLSYVTRLLKACGVDNHWNGLTGIWSISPARTPKFSKLNNNTNHEQIRINGRFYAGFQALRTKEPSSRIETAFAPIYDITKVLELLGIQNKWIGSQRTWDVSTNNLTSPPSGSSGISSNTGSSTSSNHDVYGVSKKVLLQNGAADDSKYWARADQDLYILAQTFDPNASSVPASAPRLLNLAVGQTIHLFAYSGDSNVQASQTTWVVNSPYATVTADIYGWQETTGKKLQQAHATFVASEPGIYTVQAEVNGNYTIPLVLTVGYSSLNSADFGQAPNQTGIKLFPQTNTDFAQIQANQVVTANAYEAEAYNAVSGGWIPVAGLVPSGIKTVSILLENPDTQTIYNSYTVPTYTGTTGQQFFRAEVLSPVASGPMQLEIAPNLPQYLTDVFNSQTPTNQSIVLSYTMSGGAQLSQEQLDVLPTAEIDYNMSSDFESVAQTLMENSPSVDAGIEAINNYASNFITYDQAELQPGGYHFQDVLQTLQSGSGICVDYVGLTTALLRSIGVPTETIGGTVQDPTGQLPRDPSAAHDHEWLKAWDGSQWMVMDPTWSSYGYTNGGVVSNAFVTATNEFTSDHDADTNAIGSGLF